MRCRQVADTWDGNVTQPQQTEGEVGSLQTAVSGGGMCAETDADTNVHKHLAEHRCLILTVCRQNELNDVQAACGRSGKYTTQKSLARHLYNILTGK